MRKLSDLLVSLIDLNRDSFVPRIEFKENISMVPSKMCVVSGARTEFVSNVANMYTRDESKMHLQLDLPQSSDDWLFSVKEIEGEKEEIKGQDFICHDIIMSITL